MEPGTATDVAVVSVIVTVAVVGGAVVAVTTAVLVVLVVAEVSVVCVSVFEQPNNVSRRMPGRMILRFMRTLFLPP